MGSVNQSITLLKALGITLMVLGHCGCSIPYVIEFLYMFHMPLFFFVSGFCFKPKYLQQPRTFLWKKIKSLYWPYVKWGLFFLAIHNIFFHLNLYSAEFGYDGQGSHPYTLNGIKVCALNIITRMQYHEQLLGGYWFLNALFFGSIIAYSSLRVFKRIETAAIIILGTALILNEFRITIPILKISPQAFVSAFLFLVGHFFSAKKMPVFPIWGIAISLAATIVGSFLWKCEIGSRFYDSPRLLPFLLSSVLATWSFYSIFSLSHFKGIQVKNIFFFIGNNTLTILTWHFVAFKLISLIIVLIYDLPFGRLAEFPVIVTYAHRGWWLLYFLVAIVATSGLAYCNKYIKSIWLKL